MKEKCLLCDEEFVRLLEHLSINHNISSIGEYNQKLKEKEDKKIKIQSFLKYKEELMERYRKGEISGEKLRELRSIWERENNLSW